MSGRKPPRKFSERFREGMAQPLRTYFRNPICTNREAWVYDRWVGTGRPPSVGKAKGTKEWPTPPVRQPQRFVLQMVVWGAKAKPPVHAMIFPAALL